MSEDVKHKLPPLIPRPFWQLSYEVSFSPSSEISSVKKKTKTSTYTNLPKIELFSAKKSLQIYSLFPTLQQVLFGLDFTWPYVAMSLAAWKTEGSDASFELSANNAAFGQKIKRSGIVAPGKKHFGEYFQTSCNGWTPQISSLSVGYRESPTRVTCDTRVFSRGLPLEWGNYYLL